MKALAIRYQISGKLVHWISVVIPILTRSIWLIGLLLIFVVVDLKYIWMHTARKEVLLTKLVFVELKQWQKLWLTFHKQAQRYISTILQQTIMHCSQDEILRKRPRKQIWVHFLVKVETLAYFHISSMLNPKMWVAKFSFDQEVLNFHF